MAPESERAKLNSGNHWECGDAYVVCECGGWNSKAWQEKNRCYFSHARPLFRVEQPPKEPTLTCSEVVERLAECAGLNWTDTPASGDAPYATFDTEKATAILHSRERRVQELEKCLRRVVKASVDSCDFCQVCLECDEHEESCEVGKAESLLANSEQIRKGAKHE